jgi:predicted permease
MKAALRELLNRWRAFFHKEPLDRELDQELASHLELAVDENISADMTPEEARRQALIRFGGVQQAREQQREARGLPWLDALMQDLRYTVRTLRRDRGFAAVAILILALGIGANVAVFSVVNTILLRPLPFPDSQQLVWIAPAPQKCGFSCSTYSADAYDTFRAQSHAYRDVTGYQAFTGTDNLRLTGHGDPKPATGIEVITNFFQVLGVQPVMGRLFTSDEALQNAHSVALLTNPYWRRQFAADPSIVGKKIDLNGSPTTVIGVLPASFDYGAVFSPGEKVDLFVPLSLDGERMYGNILTMIGRLKPGVTLGQAQAEARLVEPHLCWSNKQPDSCGSYAVPSSAMQLRTLKDYVSGRLRRSLIVLWCAVGVILLIVCVNLSNLLLARTAARSREFAMRSALGAGRWRLIRQLLTESLVLSGAGAMLGLALAYAVVAWLAHQGSVALPLLSEVRVDRSALAWTMLIALGAAVLFGLAPGLRFSRVDLQNALKDGGHGTSTGRQHDRMRAGLVVSEIALACVLLVGAGLLLRSFLKVMDVDLGFQPDRAASIKVEFDDSGPTVQARAAKRGAIFQAMIARISALPGVEAAGISDYLPLGPNRAWGPAVPKGKTYRKDTQLPTPLVYVVTPGYVSAMGMRLHGRDFSWEDGTNSLEAVLINRSAARFYWPGQDAVGRVLTSGGSDMHVIGVVDDVHAESVEGQPGWQIYHSAMQESPAGAQLIVRSRVPPATLAGSVLRALRELNPNQPVADFRPIRTIVDHAVSPRRFFVLLVAIFAGLGLLLASLGIYGVISYSVTRQTQEIGIRMALGASRGRVQRTVIAKTLGLALLGVGAGLAASIVAARLIASLLFGTTATDPATFAAMAGLLVLVALLAGFLPSRRASRIDPMRALRSN